MNASSPAIAIRNLHVRRGQTHILQDFNWTLPRGSLGVILGPNGSGKSTLLRVLRGQAWPTGGEIEVLGEKFGAYDWRQMRKRLAVVDPTERFTVDGRVHAIDAVLTGFFSTLWLYDEPTQAQRDRAEHLLEAVGLAHRRDHAFGVLSTGEQRRCLLARALVDVPEILALDEPTAGLDLSGRERLLATVQQLRADHPELTVVLITHHVEEIAPDTDQLLMLSEGRVAACGHPDQLITPERMSEVFGCKVFIQKRSGRWSLEVLPEAWLELLRDGKSEKRTD